MKTTILLIMATVFFAGCEDAYAPVKALFKPSADTDVTSSPNYNFSSFSGTTWETKAKTAVVELKGYTGVTETRLLTAVHFDPTHPRFLAPPDDMKVLSVLPAGTRIRIERLMKDNGAWGGVRVTATLEDGTNPLRIVYLGRPLLANNEFIRSGPTTSKDWGVNPEMLEPVRDPDGAAPSGLEAADASHLAYEHGLGMGRERAMMATDARARKILSDPWLGHPEWRLLAVKVHGEGYIAAFESGYRQGFREHSEEKE